VTRGGQSYWERKGKIKLGLGGLRVTLVSGACRSGTVGQITKGKVPQANQYIKRRVKNSSKGKVAVARSEKEVGVIENQDGSRGKSSPGKGPGQNTREGEGKSGVLNKN